METGDGITQGSLKGDNVNLITGTGNIDVSESLGEATRDTAYCFEADELTLNLSLPVNVATTFKVVLSTGV